MKNVLDFIIQYREILVSLLLCLLTFLIQFLRKKPVINQVDTILLCVLEKLPQFINSVESAKGGELKKVLVLESVKEYVKSEFSVNLPDSFIAFIGSHVENILSTPQKKER